jgi:hypothetical protein
MSTNRSRLLLVALVLEATSSTSLIFCSGIFPPCERRLPNAAALGVQDIYGKVILTI